MTGVYIEESSNVSIGLPPGPDRLVESGNLFSKSGQQMVGITIGPNPGNDVLIRGNLFEGEFAPVMVSGGSTGVIHYLHNTARNVDGTAFKCEGGGEATTSVVAHNNIFLAAGDSSPVLWDVYGCTIQDATVDHALFSSEFQCQGDNCAWFRSGTQDQILIGDDPQLDANGVPASTSPVIDRGFQAVFGSDDLDVNGPRQGLYSGSAPELGWAEIAP
jgi:hypothetical protein